MTKALDRSTRRGGLLERVSPVAGFEVKLTVKHRSGCLGEVKVKGEGDDLKAALVDALGALELEVAHEL